LPQRKETDVTAIEDARAELDDYFLNHPDPDGICDGECGRNLSGVLSALIAEHERVTTRAWVMRRAEALEAWKEQPHEQEAEV
jgi:hypothetical protein